MSIDVAVIGCGYWGNNLIRNFEAADSLNLVAVCDVMRERVEEIQKEYPQVLISTDFETVMTDRTIDAIAIATPISTHFLLAKKTLLNNKHVFLEKPMAMKSEEARELLDLSKEMNKVVMLDDTFLYSGKVMAIKEIVKSGELGDIFSIDAVRVNLNELRGMERSTGFYPDASVIWDLAPHDVAIMTSLVDAEPVRVSAYGSSPVAYCPEPLPVMAWCSIMFDNGVMGHFHVNWLAPEQMKRMVIIGSRKMLVYDDLNQEQPVVLYDKGVELFPPTTTNEPKLVRYREGDTQDVSWDRKEPLRRAVEQFRDAILEGKEPFSGPQFAMKVVTVLEATEQSISKNGEPVEIGSYSFVKH
jgi:predicted dehydrogenase